MRRHTPNGIAEYDNVSMNIRVRKIDIVLAAVDCRSRPQRPDSVAGVRGLELRNVALQNAEPDSLVSRIFWYQRLFAKTDSDRAG
jgi:hypothetical protein